MKLDFFAIIKNVALYRADGPVSIYSEVDRATWIFERMQELRQLLWKLFDQHRGVLLRLVPHQRTRDWTCWTPVLPGSSAHDDKSERRNILARPVGSLTISK